MTENFTSNYIKNDESSFNIDKIFAIFDNYDKEILRSKEIHSEENTISFINFSFIKDSLSFANS